MLPNYHHTTTITTIPSSSSSTSSPPPPPTLSSSSSSVGTIDLDTIYITIPDSLPPTTTGTTHFDTINHTKPASLPTITTGTTDIATTHHSNQTPLPILTKVTSDFDILNHTNPISLPTTTDIATTNHATLISLPPSPTTTQETINLTISQSLTTPTLLNHTPTTTLATSESATTTSQPDIITIPTRANQNFPPPHTIDQRDTTITPTTVLPYQLNHTTPTCEIPPNKDDYIPTTPVNPKHQNDYTTTTATNPHTQTTGNTISAEFPNQANTTIQQETNHFDGTTTTNTTIHTTIIKQDQANDIPTTTAITPTQAKYTTTTTGFAKDQPNDTTTTTVAQNHPNHTATSKQDQPNNNTITPNYTAITTDNQNHQFTATQTSPALPNSLHHICSTTPPDSTHDHTPLTPPEAVNHIPPLSPIQISPPQSPFPHSPIHQNHINRFSHFNNNYSSTPSSPHHTSHPPHHIASPYHHKSSPTSPYHQRNTTIPSPLTNHIGGLNISPTTPHLHHHHNTPSLHHSSYRSSTSPTLHHQRTTISSPLHHSHTSPSSPYISQRSSPISPTFHHQLISPTPSPLHHHLNHNPPTSAPHSRHSPLPHHHSNTLHHSSPSSPYRRSSLHHTPTNLLHTSPHNRSDSPLPHNTPSSPHHRTSTFPHHSCTPSLLHPPTSPRLSHPRLSGGYRGAGKMVGGGNLPPVTITRVLDAWNEMLESEKESLRDRVGDLEKKVHDQTDEIMCLRSTLADVLRRLNTMETSSRLQGPSSGGRGTPTKDGIRLRQHNSDSRDIAKRASTCLPARPVSSTALNSRRTPHYQSTSSLYSDGHSSSSVSPAPSPSPTQAPLRHHTNTTTITNTASPSPYTRPGALNKRWVSTSDFSTPARATYTSPLQHHHYHHAIASSSPSPSSPANAQLARRGNTGSLHNLTTLRHTNSPVPPHYNIARHGGKEPQYNGEDGVVKLYLRGRPLNLYVPTPLRDDYSPTATTPNPPIKLKLEWVYGYRGRDCRNNVYQLPTGEIVYFVAAVVVLYNVEEQMQRHYLGHTDDIKCLAVHPNKLIIATGQTAGHDRRDARPHIRVWDSVSLHTLHVIGISDIERSVACLAFSKADGGSLLVCVDEAPDHNMSVWDWSRGERGYKLLETKCSADQVLAVEFSPVDRSAIITCGKNHINFWSYESGMLAKRSGIFENRTRPKYVTAISFTDTGNVISGDSNGNLLIWQRGGNTVYRMVSGAHEGPVFSILVQKDGSITTGGKDGLILEWDRDLERTGNEIQVPEQFGAPRVVSSGRGSQLVVGTTRNCVLEGSFTFPIRPVMQGHTEELWALAPHPSQQQFLTCGYDRTCYLWDTMARTIVWSKDIGEPAQSAAFSSNGEIVIIGTASGRWFVMDAETREMYSQHTDGNEPIQVVQFSPNGQYLAVGSRDNNIYVYQVSEDCRKYSRVGRCQGHASFVTHLDWSADSQFLQSNSGDYELLFWNAGLCRQIVQTSQMRDVEWATNTCTLTFATLGIWPEGADGTDVNTCAKGNQTAVLATGDDFGKVKVFNSPACHQKARNHEYGGHSSHVTSVVFLHDDSRLVSAGGRDTAVMQWMVSVNSSSGASSASSH